MRMHNLALATALAAVSSVAFAAMSAPPAKEFVTKAAMSDMFEIESSKLALDKAQNADVKQFAQQMIGDHTKASQQLMAAANQAGGDLTVPAMLDAEHRSKVDKLSAASGSDFDKMYVDEQVAGHKDALDLMTAYAEAGDQPDLKAHAQKTKPVIEMHYKMIQDIDKKVM